MSKKKQGCLLAGILASLAGGAGELLSFQEMCSFASSVLSYSFPFNFELFISLRVPPCCWKPKGEAEALKVPEYWSGQSSAVS